MKTTIVSKGTAAMLVLTSLLASCTQKSAENATSQSASVEDLGQMNRDLAKALKAHDVVAAASVYDENASLLPPNEPIVSGRTNIQHYWQGAIDAGLIDASVKTLDARSDGQLGYEIGTFELKFKGPKGDTIVDIGKYTEILRRDADGKWISTYGMWSANEPATAH
jgi:ketosteroid isomerase-like protein